MLRRILRLAVPLLLAPIMLTGCEPPGSPVQGEVTFGKEKMNPGDKVVIMLANATATYSGDANEAGKFNIPNVKAGTYRVSYIHYTAMTPSTGPSKPGSSGSPNMSPKSYPDEWTVPGGPYTLDMGKLTPTKK